MRGLVMSLRLLPDEGSSGGVFFVKFVGWMDVKHVLIQGCACVGSSVVSLVLLTTFASGFAMCCDRHCRWYILFSLLRR